MVKIAQEIINIIFPSLCVVCRRRNNSLICESCYSQIEYIFSPYCFRCGKSLSEFNITIPLCLDCRRHPRIFSFNSARAVGHYKGVLRTMINVFKYKKKKRLALILGKLLIDYLVSLKENMQELQVPGLIGQTGISLIKKYQFPSPAKIDLIIPVPIHPRRERERGFNQAEILAQLVADRLNLPLHTDILRRIRYTTSQIALSPPERKNNVKDAFEIKNIPLVKNKRVLLIDDVFTTGATVQECSLVLKKAGANSVYVLTLARGS